MENVFLILLVVLTDVLHVLLIKQNVILVLLIIYLLKTLVNNMESVINVKPLVLLVLKLELLTNV